METVRQSTSSRDSPLNSQRFVGHRPGEVNPADFPCHGLTAKGEIQREAIESKPGIMHSMVNTPSCNLLDRGIDKIIDIESNSNTRSFLRVTGYVIRFINNLKKHAKKEPKNLSVLRAGD